MFERDAIPTPPPGTHMSKPFTIKGMELGNRIVRSSLGGKLGYYDGSPSVAWANFEKRFMRTGVGALISATISVDGERYSPLQYIKIASDRFNRSFRAAVKHIKTGSRAPYILQIGDPGYQCQTSLLPQAEDGRTASPVFDLLYGYPTAGSEMTVSEIRASVKAHAAAARRAKDAGCDGVEITLSKGYLVHQFMNPGINRRRDDYGGSEDKRFRFAREVVEAAREAVGPDFPLGVRLSTADYNAAPFNIRLPPRWPLRHWLRGNGIDVTTHYAKELSKLGVDWLHLSRGFGFINPKESPGKLPVEELKMVYNTVGHLSFKARMRSLFASVTPSFLLRAIVGAGWDKPEDRGATARDAAAFRAAVTIPIIVNGGFQSRKLIEDTLAAGHCDLVSMARPLLANPNLLAQFHERDVPEPPCSFCNKCSMLTMIVPVGCYEPSRFESQRDMEDHVLRWSSDPDLGPDAVAGDSELAPCSR